MVTHDFAGRTVLVTGAASGIGRAVAGAFAAAGGRVALADVAVEAGEAAAADLRRTGAEAAFLRCDVSRSDEVAGLVAGVVRAFDRLDCAVNAAGIEIETSRLVDCEESTFDRVLAVNLRSVFLSLKYEIRQMLAQQSGGAIVNIASTNSFRARPRKAAYNAAKHGVIGLTRTAAIEHAADGIRVNAICPRAIESPMTDRELRARTDDVDALVRGLNPLARLGRADEVAQAALWLCSDAASFTVGAALPVDGGYLAG